MLNKYKIRLEENILLGKQYAQKVLHLRTAYRVGDLEVINNTVKGYLDMHSIKYTVLG